MSWLKEAEVTAIEFKKNNPEWDKEAIISETMEYMEIELFEELSYTERHLRKFLNEETFNNSKTASNED